MAIVSSWCDIADTQVFEYRVCDAQTVSLSRVTSETPAYSCQFPLRGRCTLYGLPVLNGRKMRATVGQYGLNLTGYTWHTMGKTMGCDSERRSESHKLAPSSDWGLKLAPMKLESLVIACHHRAVNTSPLLAHTARQVTQASFW